MPKNGLPWDDLSIMCYFTGAWQDWEPWQHTNDIGIYTRLRKWQPEEYAFANQHAKMSCNSRYLYPLNTL